MMTGETKMGLRLIPKKKKSGGENEISRSPSKGLFMLPLGLVDLPNLIMPFTFYTLKCHEHLRTFNIAF
jgi:hypothetical protein